MQKTFSIIKPDAVKRNLIGHINQMIESSGLKILASKKMYLSKNQAEIFYEVHKYARNFDLPLYFVVGDNEVSTNTPTAHTWNNIQREIPEDVIYYKYKSKYPHYGTGKWVVF